jgi:hypothetical protein
MFLQREHASKWKVLGSRSNLRVHCVRRLGLLTRRLIWGKCHYLRHLWTFGKGKCISWCVMMIHKYVLGIVCKEAIVAYSSYYPGMCLEA